MNMPPPVVPLWVLAFMPWTWHIVLTHLIAHTWRKKLLTRNLNTFEKVWAGIALACLIFLVGSGIYRAVTYVDPDPYGNNQHSLGKMLQHGGED